MREVKKEKISEVIHRLASQFILIEGSRASLITVTRVEMSPTGKESKIYFTTLPESEEDTALKFLERKTPEFKALLQVNTEERRTAEATSTASTRKSSKSDGDNLLKKAEKNELAPEEMAEAAKAIIASMK